MALKRSDRVLAFLLLATAVTVFLGERGALGVGQWWPVLLVMGLAALKAATVVWEFMEIGHAPALWKRLLLGWLVVVTLGILLAYAIGQRA
ncbi:cytochrome C oxidase subunit IV family protein [Curvibacter sp. APW13]|uniref:cytochrome C oxidase subunit IV family protein n=1 Tax=Curvibacter sp. APW13 TaxID=3077236 RepID=UPI0028DD420F|nr:cytochrome C oxidase subunit IV family protein [Curvibacter sp. APW13]MDT8992184.1 cytochrome C oxidase subunit IV family protein [Curvibacter sp. APW13]